MSKKYDKNKDKCNHEFYWTHNTIDAIAHTDNGIAFPVKCYQCGIEGLEHYTQTDVRDKDGIILYEYQA